MALISIENKPSTDMNVSFMYIIVTYIVTYIVTKEKKKRKQKLM